MEKEPELFTDVEDAVAEYLCLLVQVELVQDDDGTQRSEEPAARWCG